LTADAVFLAFCVVFVPLDEASDAVNDIWLFDICASSPVSSSSGKVGWSKVSFLASAFLLDDDELLLLLGAGMEEDERLRRVRLGLVFLGPLELLFFGAE